MEDRVRGIIARHFKTPLDGLPLEEVIPGMVDLWDAHSHHGLVTALEEEFGNIFEFEDIGIMFEGLESILEILEKRGV